MVGEGRKVFEQMQTYSGSHVNMPRRFTVTEKWTDHWFHRLTPISKLFFVYICENVDIAGVWEIDHERAAFDMGVTESQIESALRETEKCYISDGKFLWLRNFIKYQGNLPLNENVNAHKGIIKRINQSSMCGRILEELQKNEQLTLWEGFTNPSMESTGKGRVKGKGNKGGVGGKPHLYPIPGKNCSVSGCGMPAVYRDASGAYDSYACSEHLPEKVKAFYC